MSGSAQDDGRASGSLPEVALYTDGACTGNPGPGGWGYLLRCHRTGRELSGSGGEPRTTNNRMELQAVIHGLRRLKQRSRVQLVSDSQYVIHGLREWLDGWIARGWRRGRGRGKGAAVMNEDLWRTLDALRREHEITPVWIRGHVGHPENEFCDRLAVAAAAQAALTHGPVGESVGDAPGRVDDGDGDDDDDDDARVEGGRLW
ncbi:MAG: ribonuclease HI [Phycisphaeraceae bacterium]|nr:ribonuclease HI [Phycisphaeraceae bacterium]